MSDWLGLYRDLRRDAARALEQLRPGSRVFLGSGAGEPQHLACALSGEAQRLSDVELVQVLGLSGHELCGPRFPESFRAKRFFLAAGERQAVAEGRGEFIPVYLSEIPRMISEGPLSIDAALIQVSPPDEHGYLSLGVAVDVVAEAVEQARVVIAQVNPLMPRTLGESFVHLSRLTALVEHEEPLLTYRVPPPDDTARKIAGQVAKLIKDGSTIHLGLGRLPQAVLAALTGRRNLGVHTDLLTDGYVDLAEAGVITGRNKTYLNGRIVASFCLGSRRLYDFVHDNPMVELYPTRMVNDPAVIARNHRMTTVHEAVEVDLTGQVCAEIKDSRIYAGLGGMVDFMRGAASSPGGQSIVVLTSTGPDGESRIRPAFEAGAGVAVTRAGVRVVVTEYGAAFIRGLSLSERAVALIDIAHPNHRDALLTAARQQGLIAEQAVLAPLFTGIYPEKYERSLTLEDGTAVQLRPVKPTDERMVQEFFYGMSGREVYYRFLHSIKAFPRKDMQKMVNIDYHRQMGVLALVGEFGNQEAAALARYILGDNGVPEVDFAVQDKYQGQGLGKRLMGYLLEIAKDRGYSKAAALVMAENAASLHILYNMGYAVTGTSESGVVELTLHLDQPVDKQTVDVRYESSRGDVAGPKGDEPLTRI